MAFRKLERKRAKLRMALTGVSNSGKTMGAMKIAKGMGGKICFINTESEGPDVYDNLFKENPFDVWDIKAPFSPEKYIDAIHECERSGADVIIIDSLSHAWAGTGGVLDIHDQKTQASNSKNSYLAWREVTPIQNNLIDAILESTAHIIVTMRSKTQYEVMENSKGKKEPVRIGLSPIQRDGLEYEFTVMFDIEHKSHLFTASKDRTRLFEGRNEKLSEKHGEEIISWLNKGPSFEEQRKLDVNLIDYDLSLCQNMEQLKEVFTRLYRDYPSLRDHTIDLKNKKRDLIQVSANQEAA